MTHARTIAVLLALALVGLATTTASAGECKDKGKGKDKAGKQPTQQFELKGVLHRHEYTKDKKDKKGAAKYTAFILATESGKVHLPQAPLKGKDGKSTDAVDLSQYAGKRVVIKAEGWTHHDKKKGSKYYKVHRVAYIRQAAE